jgi:hypothetical protein
LIKQEERLIQERIETATRARIQIFKAGAALIGTVNRDSLFVNSKMNAISF